MANLSKNFKLVLLAISSLSVALLVVVIVLSALLANTGTDNVCTTKSCINAANLIINNIDTTVDPCEDFNKFSCGSFIKNRRIPDDSSSLDTFTDLRNALSFALSDALADYTSSDIESTTNAKSYYRSCMDENMLEQIGEKELIKVIDSELDGWSVLKNSVEVTAESVYKRFVKLAKLNTKSLFDVYITENPKNPRVFTLRMQQPDWFLVKQKYDSASVMSAYEDMAKKVIKGLCDYQNVAFNEQDVKEMISLEKKLSQYLLSPNDKRNQKYVNTTIGNLNTHFEGFDFKKFIIDGLFSDFPKVGITENENILVEDSPYLGNFSELYKEYTTSKFNLKALDNLLVWSFLKPKTGFLPKKYKDAQLEFDKVNTGAASLPPRSRTCANGIQTRMPYAVGRLYVEKNFDESSKKAALEMIQNIQSEFKKILEEVTWMDEASKVPAREKANKMDIKIGYPDYTYDNDHLNKMYKDYQFNNDTYLQNYILASKNEFNKDFSELKEKHDTTDWITGPAIVNAFYSETNNQISFPAGILQSPFYDAKVPKYLNYGGIGSVIGHEITHGFDDQGRKYDKDGVFFDDGEVGLWTEKTIENYNERAKCIIDQYSSYNATQVNKNLIGSQTQGENIADNGGVKESFRAYRKWASKNGPEALLPGLDYTQEQLFFINYAQVWCQKLTNEALELRIATGVHSPGEFRIRGPTSNYADFARAFNCKKNQGNNPEKKCSVW